MYVATYAFVISIYTELSFLCRIAIYVYSTCTCRVDTGVRNGDMQVGLKPPIPYQLDFSPSRLSYVNLCKQLMTEKSFLNESFLVSSGKIFQSVYQHNYIINLLAMHHIIISIALAWFHSPTLCNTKDVYACTQLT